MGLHGWIRYVEGNDISDERAGLIVMRARSPRPGAHPASMIACNGIRIVGMTTTRCIDQRWSASASKRSVTARRASPLQSFQVSHGNARHGDGVAPTNGRMTKHRMLSID